MNGLGLERRFELLFDVPEMQDIDGACADGSINAWEREFLHEVRRRWHCRGIIPSPKQERCLYRIAAKLRIRWSRTSAPDGGREATSLESAALGKAGELR